MPCGDDNEAKAGKAYDLAILTGIQIPVTFRRQGKPLVGFPLTRSSRAGAAPLATPFELKKWSLPVPCLGCRKQSSEPLSAARCTKLSMLAFVFYKRQEGYFSSFSSVVSNRIL